MDTMTEWVNTPRELPLNPSLDYHLHRDSVHLKEIMSEKRRWTYSWLLECRSVESMKSFSRHKLMKRNRLYSFNGGIRAVLRIQITCMSVRICNQPMDIHLHREEERNEDKRGENTKWHMNEELHRLLHFPFHEYESLVSPILRIFFFVFVGGSRRTDQ